MLYKTINGEKFNMRKTFYPFKEFEGHTIVLNRGNKCVVQKGYSDHIPQNIKHLFEDDNNFFNDWFNGYVVFHKSELPREFALDYDRQGLQFLQIHKGITYQELITSDEEKYKKLVELKNEKFTKLNAETEKEGFQNYSEKSGDIRDWFRDEQIKIGYDWIVYGFDCNHYEDHSNPLFKDPEYIFMLVEQMESQILALAEIWDDFTAQPSTDLKRLLLDNVIAQAEIKTELGLGGLFKLMGGDEL